MNAASVLGIGLVFTLKDEVSNAASKMTQKFQQLNYVSTETAAKMESSLSGISKGFGFMAAGAAILAPLGLAVQEAANFESQLKELSAITGVTGSGLEDIGNRAQSLALKFGGDPLKSVESFKTILSRLGPDIAKSPEALQAMGDAVETLAKTMGGDALGATNALTTGMLQYGIDLTDPIKASEAMAKQMNVMAAGAQVGSAEVPQIAESLKVAGLAAKTSGLSFEEFNASVQIMGKGTVYGAEAGTALRNVLGKLGESRFLPKDAAQELTKAGVNISLLADTTIPFKDRLKELNKIQGDSALVGKLFGVENKNAAMLLMQNVGDLESWTTAVTGTNSATDQAAVIMSGFNESLTRGKAAMKVAAISIGTALLPMASELLNITGGLLSKFSEFAQSDVGKIFVKIAASVGVGLVAFGGLVSAFHTVKFAMAAIQPVLLMLKAAFASTLVPLLPYIAVAALVGAAIYGLVKAYQSFSAVLEGQAAPATGFLGFMQKIGGAIHAVMAIWDSATSEGFTLSEKLYAALESVGLGEFALNIGTYIVRIKAFFGGMSERFDNLKNVFSSVWEAFGRVGEAFNPIFDMLAKAGFSIDKLGGDVGIFSTLGGYAFDLVTYSIRAIAVALEMVANYVTFALEGFMIFYTFVTTTFSEINGYIEQFKGGFISLPELFLKIGTAIATNLLTGIKAGWSSITNYLVNQLKALPGGEAIASYFGVGGDAEGKAKTAAVNQTGLAGVGVSDTEVSPSQANSSFSKKVDNINNASVSKAQESRETSVAMRELGNAGIASKGQSNPQVNLQPKFTVQIGSRDVAAIIKEENELDDARS
jgi:TP901 family phage tail tape measure protein